MRFRGAALSLFVTPPVLAMFQEFTVLSLSGFARNPCHHVFDVCPSGSRSYKNTLLSRSTQLKLTRIAGHPMEELSSEKVQRNGKTKTTH